jgi:hypothetical protein
VLRQRCLNAVQNLCFERPKCSFSLLDEGNDLLARSRVLGANNGYFVDARVSQQALFNLGWCDILGS